MHICPWVQRLVRSRLRAESEQEERGTKAREAAKAEDGEEVDG
jgi:hypothetical protein